MPVTRSYRCTDCAAEWEAFHLNRDEPAPDCPACSGEAARLPGRFSIKTNRSRAIDLAQEVAEKTFNFTNLQDNLREGDVAAPKVSPMQTAEAEQLTRAMKEAHEAATTQGPAPDAPPSMNVAQFWQQASGTSLVDPNAGAAGAKEARALGVDPVSLVEKAKLSGQDRMKFQVLANDKGRDA